MSHKGKIQLTYVIVASPEQAKEGDRIFQNHAPWMEATHHREGDKACLSYNVSKAPELSNPLDPIATPTGNTGGSLGGSIAGLSDAFVHVLELGDYTVTYRIAGFLSDVKTLFAAQSSQHRRVLDALHDTGVEIASPMLVGHRGLSESVPLIPRLDQAVLSHKEEDESAPPSELIFDKAEEAAADDRAQSELDAYRTEAKELGIATHVADDPHAAALALAREIAERSPDAVRAAKKLLNAATLGGVAEGLRLEAELQGSLIGGANQIEAVKANMERRAPSFRDPE